MDICTYQCAADAHAAAQRCARPHAATGFDPVCSRAAHRDVAPRVQHRACSLRCTHVNTLQHHTSTVLCSAFPQKRSVRLPREVPRSHGYGREYNSASNMTHPFCWFLLSCCARKSVRESGATRATLEAARSTHSIDGLLYNVCETATIPISCCSCVRVRRLRRRDSEVSAKAGSSGLCTRASGTGTARTRWFRGIAA